jgi:GxxExxY protein
MSMKTREAVHLAHSALTGDVIGAFFQVYNELGEGFVESVYSKALVVEIDRRGIQCEREAPLVVRYRDTVVGEFRVDVLVACTVIVELKTAERIVDAHERQLRNYLKAAGLSVGLLLNVGDKPTVRRMIRTV